MTAPDGQRQDIGLHERVGEAAALAVLMAERNPAPISGGLAQIQMAGSDLPSSLPR